jgi:hypothetical protein
VELAHESRKFTFLCGHDVNLTSIGAALRLNLPETEQALEVRTPIGSKLKNHRCPLQLASSPPVMVIPIR